jgi:hypothetical protein
MPVSYFTESEFISLVLMKWSDFVDKVLKYKSPRGMMELRRQMQIACTAYANGKPILNCIPGQGEPLNLQLLSDHVQQRWLAFDREIVKLARAVYLKQMIAQIMRLYPDTIKRPGASEELAQKKYDKFLKKFRYTQKAKSIAKQGWQALEKSLSF